MHVVCAEPVEEIEVEEEEEDETPTPTGKKPKKSKPGNKLTLHPLLLVSIFVSG